MKYLLDTNICIYLIKEKPSRVIEKFREVAPLEVGISAITVAELLYGAAKSQFPERNEVALREFLLPLTVVDFDFEAAKYYGYIRSILEKQGKPIGGMDLLIAAHALSLNLVVVTNNEREFRRIENLKVENWTT
jgi:tRNA(fMet)-specific endonuclease VapC